MSESYGMIIAETAGQEVTADYNYKDYYKYNIVHEGAVGPIEVSNKVFLSGPYQYRITVDKTGYYLFRANVPNEDLVYNDDTGETTKLSGFFTLKNKNGEVINKYYFSDFRETIAAKDGTTYNDIYIGYGPEDIKRPMRYKIIMYLEKNKVYRGNLSLSSEQIYDDSCILRLSPNKDIYQYDSLDKNVNTGSLPKAPCMEEGIITKIFENYAAIVKYTAGLGKVQSDALYNDKISGINCCLMWAIDEALVNNFTKPLPLTTTNIFYIDQSLGGWLYTQLTYISNENKYKDVLKNKIKNFIVGSAETGISTSIPILLVEGGIITSEAATPVGVVICVLFLFMHALETSKDKLDEEIELLHKYVIREDNILNTPVALKFKTKRAILKTSRQLYDNPGYIPDPVVLTANEFNIEVWDGTVIGALGEELKYGNFVFSHYSESGRNDFMDKLKQEINP